MSIAESNFQDPVVPRMPHGHGQAIPSAYISQHAVRACLKPSFRHPYRPLSGKPRVLSLYVTSMLSEMLSVTRRAVVISTCLAILAFIPPISAFKLNAQRNQNCPDATSDTGQTINVELNFNGPVNIYQHPAPLDRLPPDFASWGGCYFAGMLIFVSAFLLWPRYYPEQKLLDPKGRTAAIVSVPAVRCDHISGVAEGASNVPLIRGRQLATQDSGGDPRPRTPPLWVTEYPASVEASNKLVDRHAARRVGRSLAVDQEEKTDAHQEPQPNLQGRPPTKTRGPGAPVVSAFSPLRSSLYGRIRWFILVVAVNYGPVTDPESDLKFWIATLWDSTHQKVTFKSLAGAKATLKSIEKELTSLYSQAWMTQGISRPNLLIYLTGEGDGTGGMHLSNGTSISGKDIKMWLQNLQKKYKLDRPPTVLFDMCRYGVNPDEQVVEMFADMNIIYSCFPGEGALAMSFGRPGTLLSAFSLAFVMTSCDGTYSFNDSFKKSSTTDTEAWKKAVEERLRQLTNVVNLSRRSSLGLTDFFAHVLAILSKILNVLRPREVDLLPQTPDWRQAKNLELIIDLAGMISKMEKVQEVYTFVANDKFFCEANFVSSSVPENIHSPTVKNHTTQHRRGKNVPPANSQEPEWTV